MLNPIKEIYKFNKDAGLLEKPYDDFLESSFQVEEALEGFILPSEKLLDEHGNVIIDATVTDKREKHISRDIISWASGCGTVSNPISDVDRLDKACDAVVYAIGSMAKLGLNPQDITKALNIVMDCNNTKLKQPKDEHGKLMKPENFIGPEPRLQLLLDKRVK